MKANNLQEIHLLHIAGSENQTVLKEQQTRSSCICTCYHNIKNSTQVVRAGKAQIKFSLFLAVPLGLTWCIFMLTVF